jgi:hypothetical protein
MLRLRRSSCGHLSLARAGLRDQDTFARHWFVGVLIRKDFNDEVGRLQPAQTYDKGEVPLAVGKKSSEGAREWH